MGTIFKHNNQLIQCQNLQKKLKKMKLSLNDIEIIKDDIPNDILEKIFVEVTKASRPPQDTDVRWKIYIYQNSKGYYLWGVRNPSLNHYSEIGYDVSDYKLIDECLSGSIPDEYFKWNPEVGTGRKNVI